MTIITVLRILNVESAKTVIYNKIERKLINSFTNLQTEKDLFTTEM